MAHLHVLLGRHFPIVDQDVFCGFLRGLASLLPSYPYFSSSAWKRGWSRRESSLGSRRRISTVTASS